MSRLRGVTKLNIFNHVNKNFTSKDVKLGEVVFAAFDYARKSCGLTGTELVSEGLIPYRQKLYAV